MCLECGEVLGWASICPNHCHMTSWPDPADLLTYFDFKHQLAQEVPA